MLQTLLEERFSLVVHTGDAPMPAYLLTGARRKSQAERSEGTGDPSCEPQPPPANQAAGAVPHPGHLPNETMEKLAEDVHN